jgi:hypothetical protein
MQATTQSALSFWQLLTVVSVPSLMVLMGILFNRQDSRELGGNLDRLSAQLHSDMMMTNSILRDHEGRSRRLES